MNCPAARGMRSAQWVWLLLLLAIGAPVSAQHPVEAPQPKSSASKGSISGTAIDPQRAVVTDAQVRLTRKDSGAVFQTTTDSSGVFRFTVPSGDYALEITGPGLNPAKVDAWVSAGTDIGVGYVKMTVSPQH